MSRSNDAGHFFQTSNALATSERKAEKAKNKHGNPIELTSKILAAVPSPSSPHAVFVAEAAGEVEMVDLESRETKKLFSQGQAPVSCLAVQSSISLFAGSWDKIIYHINPTQPAQPPHRLQGHTDFIKTLLCTTLAGSPILISGSADATIIIWDISSPSSPSTFGKPLHKLKGHSKALQDLVIDESSTPDDRSHIILFSSSSTAEIRRWYISPAEAYELPESIETPIRAHETSVYKVVFDSSGDLWTASADKTARHLVRERGWECDTTLAHPDFVRCVLPVEDLGLVVTGCRDEEVRVWDVASGRLVCTYSGHFEEVDELLLAGDGRGVVSFGLDGTVRQWSLRRDDMEKYLAEVAKDRNGDDEQVNGDGGKPGMLTAEEEAELAELMDSDDEG